MSYVTTSIPVGLQQYLEASNQSAGTGSLLLECAGSLYYVTLAQVGTTQATNNVWILQSTDQGTSWQLVANTNLGFTGFGFGSIAVVQTGTTIYLALSPLSTSFVVIVAFNAGPNTFGPVSAAGPIQPGSFGSISACIFSDASITVGGQDNAGNVAVANYSTAGSSWGSATILEAASFSSMGGFPVQATVDRGYLVYAVSSDFTNWTLKVAPITKPATLGTRKTLTTLTGNGVDGICQYRTGLPVLASTQFTQDSATFIPVVTDAGALVVYRGTMGTNPTFSTDTVQSGISGQVIETFTRAPLSPVSAFSWPPFSGGGATNPQQYVFYCTDNGLGTQSPLAQSFLYSQQYLGSGVWGPAVLISASTIPREPFTPYLCSISNALYAILWGLVDPTQFGGAQGPEAKINSLTIGAFVNASQFVLNKIVVAMKRDPHMPVRGAAQ